jgi:hypothetical protein
MKQLFLAAFFLCACGGDDDAGDRTDITIADGALAEPDASAQSCVPSGSCLQGPPCGDDCCGSGEQCMQAELGPTCVCGQGPACDTGDSCEAAGPIGEDECGSVCCGPGNPCPQ